MTQHFSIHNMQEEAGSCHTSTPQNTTFRVHTISSLCDIGKRTFLFSKWGFSISCKVLLSGICMTIWMQVWGKGEESYWIYMPFHSISSTCWLLDLCALSQHFLNLLTYFNCKFQCVVYVFYIKSKGHSSLTKHMQGIMDLILSIYGSQAWKSP